MSRHVSSLLLPSPVAHLPNRCCRAALLELCHVSCDGMCEATVAGRTDGRTTRCLIGRAGRAVLYSNAFPSLRPPPPSPLSPWSHSCCPTAEAPPPPAAARIQAGQCGGHIGAVDGFAVVGRGGCCVWVLRFLSFPSSSPIPVSPTPRMAIVGIPSTLQARRREGSRYSVVRTEYLYLHSAPGGVDGAAAH